MHLKSFVLFFKFGSSSRQKLCVRFDSSSSILGKFWSGLGSISKIGVRNTTKKMFRLTQMVYDPFQTFFSRNATHISNEKIILPLKTYVRLDLR